MSRKKMIWIPDSFYNISSRGNNREPLFHSPDDFDTFFNILDHLHENIPFELASYCLMTNHYHLQMRCAEVPISKMMFFINKRYANYFNNKYELKGHVFEKRYYGGLIRDEEGMLAVSRYIHMNPVEACIVGHPHHYLYSSYKFYVNPDLPKPPYMNIHSILDLYTGTTEEKLNKYLNEVPVTTRILSNE
ncbi:transposase [Bacillus sp. DNRA2]|uniref:transposase n=1 Tax=Bacillus sp. DNRA2 TaxID=2723053 RepID=UPI00145F205D|nr:transposase [Bacillus sp. DNRA2]NMD68700.1 transposase [Bacillus sp. DNRA2]